MTDLKNENKKGSPGIIHHIKFNNYFLCPVETRINLQQAWVFFVLDNNHPKYQKNIFLLTDKFPVHYGILISTISTRDIFFKLCNAVKQTFSSSAKASSSTDIPASNLLRYSFGRNFEYALREINVTNAIYLQIEINTIYNLKQLNLHRKIENSVNRDCCQLPGMLRSEYHH